MRLKDVYGEAGQDKQTAVDCILMLMAAALDAEANSPGERGGIYIRTTAERGRRGGEGGGGQTEERICSH